METTITGRVWKFGDNISGDNGIINFSVITDFTKPFDEGSLAEMCFAKIDPEFPTKVRQGDVVVAGSNFAHHSHPQVALAMKAAGIAAVVVESTETGFLRKCLNVGLPLLPCPSISGFVEAGHELAVDLTTGEVRNLTAGTSMQTKPFSSHMLAILGHGGLVLYLKDRFAEGGEADASVGRQD